MNEVALFENALRAAVPAQPNPLLGEDLVRRLAATARTATLEGETRAHRRPAEGRRPWRLAAVVKIAVAVALIPLALAGLAYAGVNLPQPARDAFNSLGIDLPNQPSEHSEQGTKPHGNDVSGAAKSGPAGQHGNSAAAHRHARDQHSKAHGKAVGHTHGKAIGLNEGTPPGQSKEPPGQSNEPSGQAKEPPGPTKTPPGQTRDSAAQLKASGSSENHAAEGVGQVNPLPPQASGKALGHEK